MRVSGKGIKLRSCTIDKFASGAESKAQRWTSVYSFYYNLLWEAVRLGKCLTTEHTCTCLLIIIIASI